MEEFIIRYGLVAVLVGAILEGDVTLILAGAVAHLGFLHLLLVIGSGVWARWRQIVPFIGSGGVGAPA